MTLQSNRSLIVAEAGINHLGELSRAKEMIKVAAQSGADVVKFQTFRAAEICASREQMFTYTSQGRQVSEPMLDMFERFELRKDDWPLLAEYARKCGIKISSTPQNFSDYEIIKNLDFPFVKIGSDDLTNIPLIDSISREASHVVLSTGMATASEIFQAVEAVRFGSGGPRLTLLVCTSQYPAQTESLNLNRILSLRNSIPGVEIGYSDHSQGNLASTMAVALGATFFERHFTLDHDLPGPDHWFSLDPDELVEWVQSVRNAELALGSGRLEPSSTELDMRHQARRSFHAKVRINVGDVLTTTNVALLRPADGLPPTMQEFVLGSVAGQTIEQGEAITMASLLGES